MAENIKPPSLLPVTPEDQMRYEENARTAARELMSSWVEKTEEMQLLPIDAVGVGQDPWEYAVDSQAEPAHIDDTDAAAAIVRPNFAVVKDAIHNDKDATKIIDEVEECLSVGGNVFVPAAHKDIVDVAFAVKIVSDMVTRSREDQTPPASTIIVSKGVTEVGWNLNGHVLPTMSALHMLFKTALLSWPRTDAARDTIEKHLPSNVVANQNALVKSKLDSMLKIGGLLVAVAPSGTTKHQTSASDQLKLSPASKGSLGLMIGNNSKILAAETDFGKNPGGILHNELIKADGIPQAEAVMGLLETMARQLPKYMKLPADVRHKKGISALDEDR